MRAARHGHREDKRRQGSGMHAREGETGIASMRRLQVPGVSEPELGF